MNTGTRNSRGLAFVLLLAILTTFAPASPAAAASSFQISWTEIGIYPRAAADMNSQKVGAALADGAWISVECETLGTYVESAVAYTNIWERLIDGTYIPNAFVETGANGWTPGVPRCETPPGAEQPTEAVPTIPAPPQPAPVAPAAPQPEAPVQEPIAPAAPTVGTYDREAAATWASEHYDDGDTWFIPDCTTFASSVLRAGGISATFDWQPNSTEQSDQASDWLYFLGWGSGPTKRWAAADFLKNYLVSERAIATIAEISPDDASAGGAQLGDLIMYDWGNEDGPGVIDHVAVVTGFSPEGTVLVTQKEADQFNREWAWSLIAGKPFAEDNPGTRFYLIHITG